VSSLVSSLVGAVVVVGVVSSVIASAFLSSDFAVGAVVTGARFLGKFFVLGTSFFFLYIF